MFSVVKRCLRSERIFLYVENERSTSTEVLVVNEF
jgi:hypothetical protein